jgi:chemotaxis family two-component system response regulator PixH
MRQTFMSTALIVEDCLTDQQAIAECLYQSGFDVLIASSTEEALEKMSIRQPDAIVLDVILPGRSGFELCRQLKGDPRTAKIPVVLCSTKITELDRFWGLKQGADAYLAKPIVREELVQTIKQLVRNYALAA